MKKLQVKNPDGTWSWVFGRKMPEKTLLTCEQKSQALPPNSHWGSADLAWATEQFPSLEFRLASELETHG